jgi:hypothetical protein
LQVHLRKAILNRGDEVMSYDIDKGLVVAAQRHVAKIISLHAAHIEHVGFGPLAHHHHPSVIKRPFALFHRGEISGLALIKETM